MELYLIRHGESHVNVEGWQGGNVDVGLTEWGRRQAEALAQWLPGVTPAIDALYASTMQRARETAEVVAAAYGCAVRYDDRLREVGNNRRDHTPWPDGAPPKEYAPYSLSSHPFSPSVVDVEEGETWMHFRTRVGLFIEDCLQRHMGQTVLAVCHGGVISAAFANIFNIGPYRRCEVWISNTGVTRFAYIAERQIWRLYHHDRTEHLRGLSR